MFTFELGKCAKSGTVVVCDVVVTNNDRLDKKLSANSTGAGFPNGRAFDDQGNESKLDSFQIGSAYKNRDAVLIPGVAVKSYFRFEGVSPSARVFKRVDLMMEQHFSEGGDYKRREFTVSFSDVVLR